MAKHVILTEKDLSVILCGLSAFLKTASSYQKELNREFAINAITCTSQKILELKTELVYNEMKGIRIGMLS